MAMGSRAERLLLARAQAAAFAEEYPFHTAVIARMRVLVDPAIGSMGVSMEGSELLLHVNEAWLEAHAAHALGLLLHEVHHVVLGHLVDVRLREVDAPELMDVCLECAANEHIVEELPNPIRWQQFERFGFRPNQSSLERYALLRDHVQANEHARRLPMPAPSDDHAGLREPVARSSVAAQRAIVEELEALEERLGDASDATIAGWRPGDLRRALFPEAGRAEVDWRAALRDLVARSSRTVSSYKRPSRRFPERLGEVPGRQRQRYAGEPPHLVVGLDTSASMTDADLADAARELARLARIARITVVEFDAAIHAVYRYRKGGLERLTGGGGTDFRVLFGPDSPTHGAEAAVIFTDAVGPFPERPPAVPTLWVLTGSSPAEPPFGRRARFGRAATR
jgi:predicted metal-dependent peptidase